MGSVDRSKKRIQVWKKVLLHFSLCFVTGFFTGFAPTSTAPLFSGQANPYRSVKNLHASAKPVEEPGGLNRSPTTSKTTPTTNRASPGVSQTSHRIWTTPRLDERQPNLVPARTIQPAGPVLTTDNVTSTSSTSPKVTLPMAMAAADRALVIVVTTATRAGDPFRGALLRRLASTLKLVPSPLLWIVVEASSDETGTTAEILRKTGVMYRHLTYKEKLTGAAAETDRYQRNVALNHIELHRLNGVVHFADVANVYDLGFFEEIREIEVFGAWTVVTVSANRKRVVVEGPVCSSSSKVVGWQSKILNSRRSRTLTKKMKKKPPPPPPPPPPPSRRMNTFGFAFKSSILWDPQRWGRRSSSSVPDISQDSVKFVQEEVLEDESKLRGIPTDCSKVMLWHLHIPRVLPPPPQRD